MAQTRPPVADAAMTSNGEYTFYNLDDCRYGARRYEGASFGPEDGDRWHGGPYDHRGPGSTVPVAVPYNDRPERCQPPPPPLRWTSVPHSGQHIDGCVSRCSLDRSLPSQCGLQGDGHVTPLQGPPYGSTQPHHHHHRQGNGYHGLGATGERIVPRGGGLCPQGRAPRISPIVYEFYSDDAEYSGSVYPGFPSCPAADGLCFPPHGNCLIGSDHNSSITTYKWMTVKRGLTKRGKNSHIHVD